jgi:hypothetical protein
MASPGEGGKLSFERDIRPLFRAKDRDSMATVFDLFDNEDVADNAGHGRDAQRVDRAHRPHGRETVPSSE